MSLLLLHLDDALRTQPDFLEYCCHRNAREADFSESAKRFRLWGKKQELEDFRAQLKKHTESKKDEPLITFTGSGDFHHITKLLLSCLMEDNKEKITVIHFDNHPDWVHFDDGMHCGSWVNKALEIPNVEKVITIGVCSKDLNFPEFKGANLENLRSRKIVLFPYSHKPSFVLKNYGDGPSYKQLGKYINWQNIEDAADFTETIFSEIKTHQIYITIDKDVLDNEDAATNWDQGKMKLPFLLKLLKQLTSEFNILGVDIVGDYSKPKYDGSSLRKIKKHAEIYMDQPKMTLEPDEIAKINTRSNMAILNVLEENLL